MKKTSSAMEKKETSTLECPAFAAGLEEGRGRPARSQRSMRRAASLWVLPLALVLGGCGTTGNPMKSEAGGSSAVASSAVSSTNPSRAAVSAEEGREAVFPGADHAAGGGGAEAGRGGASAEAIELDLALEYRNTAHVSLVVEGDQLTGTLTAGEGYGNDLIAANVPLSGSGRLLHFPEARLESYTLTFSGPAIPDGPCGDSPITYGFTFSGQTNAQEWQGGLAPYCGDNTNGRPQRMLRLKGSF